MASRALITGITGQDGSYLAEFLSHKGYEVHGLIRRSSSDNTRRIDHLLSDSGGAGGRLLLHYGDLVDGSGLTSLIREIGPDEVYHLGAQSQVAVSFESPEYTGNVTGLGTVRMLEAIAESGLKTRLYSAASSEMFGDALPPQNEETPLQPRSPYAVAKVYSYWMVRNYREGRGLFACSGIMFNHESQRRGETFVTRKISRGVAEILAGRRDCLYLGNLAAKRDWGYAPEYVQVMWRMLQQDRPADYVIGTGESHSVQEFVEEAFAYAGLDWEKHVKTAPGNLRPLDVSELVADSTKARRELGWEPRVTFRGLIRIMVDADLEAAGLPPIGEGKAILAQLNMAGIYRLAAR